MRPAPIIVLAAAVMLTACAANRAHMASAGPSDFEKLQDDCTARGGVLQPAGRLTGRPQLDNICRNVDPSKAMSPLR